MTRFELPMVTGVSSVNRALTDAIEADKLGVFVRTVGELRVVHYDALLDAFRAGKRLMQVAGEPVVRIAAHATDDAAMTDYVESTGHKFGLIGVIAGKAALFSVSASHSAPYTLPSTGARCHREQQPAGTPARAWFHYYPPNVRDQARRNECVICGAYLP
jgi:hypothetical protein